MTTLLLAVLLISAPGEWWKNYGDPILDRIVEKVSAGNLDLKVAVHRITEARATTGEQRSALGPQVQFNAGAQRLRGGYNQGVVRIPNSTGTSANSSFVTPFDTGLLQGGLDARWELDLFGANRATLAAARADVVVQEQLRAELLLTLTAEAARNYMELRGIEERLSITKQHVETQQDLLNLATERSRVGLDTHTEVERQAISLAMIEALIPSLESERSVRLHRLAVLTGDFDFAPEYAQSTMSVPSIQGGIPADILKRRPDVRAAEARLVAAAARLKQSKANRYPKIIMSGLIGRQSTDVGGLSLGAGTFFNVGPQIQLPIFNLGRIRSQIAATDARLQRERTEYEGELLKAMEESSNAIIQYQQQEKRVEKLFIAQQAALSSLAMQEDLHNAGVQSFLAVLNAQRTLLDLRFQHADARTEMLVDSVAIYKSLAGGWPTK